MFDALSPAEFDFQLKFQVFKDAPDPASWDQPARSESTAVTRVISPLMETF